MQMDPGFEGLSRLTPAEELILLRARVDQLQGALESRIVIEQAKGAVSVRCGVPVDVAFEMIREVARGRRRGLQGFCAELVANGGRFVLDGHAEAHPERRDHP